MFEIDANEMLSASAIEMSTGKQVKMPAISHGSMLEAMESMAIDFPGSRSAVSCLTAFPTTARYAPTVVNTNTNSETNKMEQEKRPEIPVSVGSVLNATETVQQKDLILVEHRHLNMDQLNLMMSSKLRSAMQFMSLHTNNQPQPHQQRLSCTSAEFPNKFCHNPVYTSADDIDIVDGNGFDDSGRKRKLP